MILILVLKPVDEIEVKNMIHQLNVSKSCGPNSVPTKIQKSNLETISLPLCHIIICLSKKVAFQICYNLPIFALYTKRNVKRNVKTIDRYHYY